MASMVLTGTDGRRSRGQWLWTVGLGAGFGIICAYDPRYGVALAGALLLFVVVATILRRAHIPVGLAIFAATGALLYVVPSTLAYFSGSAGAPSRVLGTCLVGGAVIWFATDVTMSTDLARWRHNGAGRHALWLLMLVALTGAVVGLLRNNAPGLILSDVLRLALSALGIVLGIGLNRRRVHQLVGVVGAVLVTIDVLLLCAYAAELVGGRYTRMGGGSAAAIAYGLMLLGGRTHRRQLLGATVLLIEFAVMTLSLTRGLWIAAAVTVLVSLIAFGSGTRKGVAVLCIVVVTAVAFAPLRGSASSAAIERRITTTLEQGGDEESIAHRLAEARAAWSTLGERQGGLVVGAGLGATYDDAVGVDNHHIHITLVSVAFRHGLPIALVFVVACAWCVVMALRTPMRAKRGATTTWAAALVLMASVMSLSSYVLVGELLPAIAIGWLLRRDAVDSLATDWAVRSR